MADAKRRFLLPDQLQQFEDSVRVICVRVRDNNGIKSGISFVGKAVKGVASAIESFLHFSVPDKDPLADADTYMPDFMKLLTKGITGKKDTVVSRVKDMVTKVKEQMLA